MTIKEFAKLCGCNPQTLRYYDHMNLLKPVKVDEWTGYRYYEDEQALVFVKIKNLQTAGFSIEEIKGLLDADDDTIYRAFSEKIKEQEDKLKQIKEIQLSYQTEMTKMQNKINEVREMVSKSLQEYDPVEEFGITKEERDAVASSIKEVLDSMEKMDLSFDLDFSDYKIGDETEEEPEYLNVLDNPDYKVVYEKHGWKYVKEFLNEFSELEGDKEYFLQFDCEPQKANSTAFINTILGILNYRNRGKQHSFACDTTVSKDGANHFWLLIKK